MRRILRLTVIGLAVGSTMSACKPEEVIQTENIPTAGVRFINAVPDSSGAFGLDFRFVDLVESNAQFRVTFRNNPTTASGVTAATLTQYKNARAGSRRFVVFLDDTIQAIASTKLKDSTLTLEAGKNYTVIMWGAGRAGQMKLKVIEETLADPGAKVAVRVINATGAAIDASQYTSTTTVPATPTWANVPAFTASTYVLVDPSTAASTIRLKVRAAGGTTDLFPDMTALRGALATSSLGAGGKLDISSIPGTDVAGSAVSLIVFPSSTVGARTPQTAAFLVPAGAFVWDRRPPIGF